MKSGSTTDRYPYWPRHGGREKGVLCLALSVFMFACSATELLPELLRFKSGAEVATSEDWNRRRSELMEAIQFYEYGHIPERPLRVGFEPTRERRMEAIGALETRGHLKIQAPFELSFEMALYRPMTGSTFPVLIREEHALGHTEEVGPIVARGFMFIEFAREELAPDNATDAGPARKAYPDQDWGTLAIWAWGSMRVVDYLESREDVKPEQIGIVGHSRGGKMALLAGALDERFTLVAANGSGCGGAGCFRIQPKGVETLELITRAERFGYWFHPRLREYAGREEALPLDQHFLKALVAPRALICTEATNDLWANPEGNKRTSKAAQEVFDFLGASERNALHFREGGHDFTAADWEAILDFAQWHWSGMAPDDRRRFRQF